MSRLLITAMTLVAEADAYFFYSLGDWGGDSDSKPTTKVELNNGKSMASIFGSLEEESKPRFVMLVGDNFYSSGIHGNEYSSRFHDTFEAAFPSSLDMPFYAVAGNHDHGGNVTAQIEYSKHSSRWNFDKEWYTFTEEHDGVTTQVVYIDTVVFAGMSYQDEETGEFVSGEYHPMQVHAPSQLQWLEDTLKASTADYLWVSGHYPIYSQCSHGPTSDLIKSVLPLMKKYKATGFIAGHDHCSGYYYDDGIAHVLAGAGKECCYSPSNLGNSKNPGTPLFRMDSKSHSSDGGGFASYTVSSSNTTIRFHAANDGHVQYTAAPLTPRKLA